MEVVVVKMQSGHPPVVVGGHAIPCVEGGGCVPVPVPRLPVRVLPLRPVRGPVQSEQHGPVTIDLPGPTITGLPGPTQGKGDAQLPQPLLQCRRLAQASIGVKRQHIEGEGTQVGMEGSAEVVVAEVQNLEVGQGA